MGVLNLTEAESTVDPCATPGCRQDGGKGRFQRFCEGCADNLARIRAEYEEERGMRCISFKNGRKTVQTGPRCCAPGCSEPRKPPNAYCTVCHACGITEDEAA